MNTRFISSLLFALRGISPCTLLFVALATSHAQTPAGEFRRTVCPIERGSLMVYPFDNDYSKIGIQVIPALAVDRLKTMRPDAIKVRHGRFNHFCALDETTFAYFPYRQFCAFNDAEIAAGRPGLFVTAGGPSTMLRAAPSLSRGGQPVYCRQSWPKNRPNEPEHWARAVNVRDDRYIRFWINEYVRKRLLDAPYQNVWVGLDNCTFMIKYYAPDQGWDRPFPQSDQEWLDAVKTFFRRVKELAPEIKVMCNMGSISDEKQFPEIYKDVGGVMTEDWPGATVDGKETKWGERGREQTFRRLQWLASQNKAALIRSEHSDDPAKWEASARYAYAAYLLVRGENFFYCMGRPGAKEVPPGACAGMADALGKPTAPVAEEQPGLWRRECEGGRVYVNWTTGPVTIAVAPGYTDREGKAAASVTIPRLQGEYVLRVKAR